MQVHYVAVKKPDLNPKAEDESLCGVIFVARPHTAFVLNKLIQEVCNWDPDLFFIKSSHLTGHGFAGRAARSHQAELQCRKQEEILRKFRNKELNLLVATPEVEEGVDMPRCNLVMRFELPHNYRSYVQSKVRAGFEIHAGSLIWGWLLFLRIWIFHKIFPRISANHLKVGHESYECLILIFKWVALTWLINKGTRIVVPIMTLGLTRPIPQVHFLPSAAIGADGYRCRFMQF